MNVSSTAHWGERFNDAGVCKSHNDAGCPSCLAYALGDLQISSDIQRRELQARNTELVEQRRVLTRRLNEMEVDLVRSERILAALRTDYTSRRFFLHEEWLLLHPAEGSYLTQVHQRHDSNHAHKE